MIRMNLPWFLQVVDAIDALSNIKSGAPVMESLWPIFNAKGQLEALFDQSIYRPHLRISRDKANVLHQTLNGFGGTKEEMERELTEYEVWSVLQQRDDFKLVFMSELSTLPAFLVLPKEGYDVSLLVGSGTSLFPSSMLAKAPETYNDAMEAGKALAFELGTSCGFHVFRVTESILKRYWDEVSAGESRPKLETIGSYASELEKGKFGEAKVWESLRQMAKLHRNPLIHPEVILTVEEAIGIIGIARSVIAAMLRVLPDVPPTTTG